MFVFLRIISNYYPTIIYITQSYNLAIREKIRETQLRRYTRWGGAEVHFASPQLSIHPYADHFCISSPSPPQPKMYTHPSQN